MLEVISNPGQSTVASNDDCAEDQNCPKADRHGWKHGQHDPAPPGRKAHQPPSDTCNREKHQQPSHLSVLALKIAQSSVSSRQRGVTAGLCPSIQDGAAYARATCHLIVSSTPTLVCR